MRQHIVEWLRQAKGNGHLPLFDEWGDRIPLVAIEFCKAESLIEPVYANPLKPGWTVFRVTDRGRAYAAAQNDNDEG